MWYECTCDNLEIREKTNTNNPRKAIISRGRYAGKKVVLLMPVDNGSKGHPFPHAIVAGIERYPSTVTKRMSKARQAKRSKVKPFIKVVNYNHLMPTRYTLELEGLKNTVTSDTFKEVSQREEAKKTVKKTFDERYQSGKNRWFFTPLREYTRKRKRHKGKYGILTAMQVSSGCAQSYYGWNATTAGMRFGVHVC